MSKFSKIIIFIFLTIAIGLGVFTIFHFSEAENDESNIFVTKTSELNFKTLKSFSSSSEGSVYICPEATSLKEINPRCFNKIILKLGEKISGLTLTTTTYEDQDYYLVLGFENGGGGVNLPPTANANGPYFGNEGSPTNLNASNSSDPNNDPLQYRWDFNGDGIFDTEWLDESTTTHIWGDDYSGIIKLEVNDGEFADIINYEVNIINILPVAKIESANQANSHFILPGQTLIFNGSFIDQGWLDIHGAVWNFGDGIIIPGNLNEENQKPDATGKITNGYAYSSPGIYNIVLIVSDDDGGTGTDTIQIKITTAKEAVEILNNYIQNLPGGAFKNNPSQRKKAFSKKFQAIIRQIENQEYLDATDKLQRDIRPKADGDETAEDWIISSVAQKEITKMIDALVVYIQSLSF